MSNYGACIACGKSFRSAIAEAKHRHNFPVLCKRNTKFKRWEDRIKEERNHDAKTRG